MATKPTKDTHDEGEHYFKPEPATRTDAKTERPPTEAETGVHQPYPARRYKYGEPTMVVDNADEDAALGTGWSKSPEALITPPPEPEIDPTKGKGAK